GLALGIRQANVPVGGLVASLALPPLADSAGLGWAFFALGAACGAGAGAAAVLLRDPPPRRPPPTLSRPPRRPAAWRISWSSALLIVGQTATLSFTVLFLHSDRGVSTGAAAAVLAASQVLGATARIAAGHWSDRLGARIAPMRLLALAVAGTLVVVGLLTDSATWLLVPVLIAAGGGAAVPDRRLFPGAPPASRVSRGRGSRDRASADRDRDRRHDRADRVCGRRLRRLLADRLSHRGCIPAARLGRSPSAGRACSGPPEQSDGIDSGSSLRATFASR